MTSPFMRRTSADSIISGGAGAVILICCTKAGDLVSGLFKTLCAACNRCSSDDGSPVLVLAPRNIFQSLHFSPRTSSVSLPSSYVFAWWMRGFPCSHHWPTVFQAVLSISTVSSGFTLFASLSQIFLLFSCSGLLVDAFVQETHHKEPLKTNVF